MSRKAYPEYKPSGAEWLGDVPEHWGLKPLKRIFVTLNGSTPKSGNPDYWDGDVPWATPDDLGSLNGDMLKVTRRMITQEGYASCGVSLAPEGSLVLSTRAPIGHLAIAGVTLCTNQGCRCLVFRGKNDRRFYYYQVLSAREELESLGQGSTFKELSRDKLTSVNLASPPLAEQRAIAVFLDRETARIDALIEKKQRQIKLLHEKRAALISHTVTKGLDPNIPMKDSGIEWLGEIPAHWEARKLKYLIEGRLVNGLFKKKEFFGSGTKLVNVFDVYREDFLVDHESLERVEADEVERQKYGVKSGDIFFVRSSLKMEGVGRSVCAMNVPESTVFECHVVRARPAQETISPTFLIHFLNSIPAINRFISLANLVTMATIDQDKIKSLEVPLPPRDEQDQIMAVLDRDGAKTENLERKIVDSIERLREYRTSLISAAVTGKIDVRGEVA